MVRINNRAIELAEFINMTARHPYDLSTHNCLGFVNTACRIMRGEGFADDILAKFTLTDGSVEAAHEILGSDGLMGLADQRLKRRNRPGFGTLCASSRFAGNEFDCALGVAIFPFAYFFGKTKLLTLDARHADINWSF